MPDKADDCNPGKPIHRFSQLATKIASGKMRLPVSLEDGTELRRQGTGCEISWDDAWDQWNNSWSQEFDNNY
jgi:hypothetical protein